MQLCLCFSQLVTHYAVSCKFWLRDIRGSVNMPYLTAKKWKTVRLHVQILPFLFGISHWNWRSNTLDINKCCNVTDINLLKPRFFPLTFFEYSRNKYSNKILVFNELYVVASMIYRYLLRWDSSTSHIHLDLDLEWCSLLPTRIRIIRP